MARINIMSVFETFKTLVNQAEEYAQSGYSSASSDLIDSSEKVDSTKKVELNTKNIPAELLSAISSNFNSIINFIESFLLSDSQAMFYGSFLIGMEPEICFSQKGFLDADVAHDPIVFKFNPFYAKNLSLNEMIGSVINEIVKIIYLHPITYANLNGALKDKGIHNLLEKASSVSSSETVFNDIRQLGSQNRIKLPDDTYTYLNLDDELTNANSNLVSKNSSSLEYYYKILNTLPQDQQNGNGDNENNKSSQSTIAMPGSKDGNDIHNWENINNKDDAAESIKGKISEIYNSLSETERGYIPGSIVEQINALFKKPELNWKAILKKFIGCVPYGNRPTKLRLNRRQPERFDLSGTLSNKLVKLVIAIDTSGSMSSSDIEYVFGEIFGMLKNYKTDITVIECDTEIGKVYQPRTLKQITTKVTGRGGTSYIPVIEYINAHKYRDAVMIYFTDGYGDSRIPKPKTYRNLWVVLRDKNNLSLSNPYGEVKTLMGDEDYKNRNI